MTEVVIAAIGQTEIDKHWNIGSRLVFAVSIFLLSMLALTSCAPAPTEPVLADSFFSGQAFLDTNDNSQIDPEDTPVANATFIVTLQGGGEFGGQTDDTGNAFVTIPANVKYPVTVRMEAPKDSTLILVEPSTITLPEPTGETIKFLFSSK